MCAARRKQGGSQSLNDQAKGNAKSAGAQLRRYGEQALQDVSCFDLIYVVVCLIDVPLGHSQSNRGMGGRHK